jgi:succinoglycan biosynthesis protein ExoV
VRGPLTAAALDLPQKTAIIDGAALLRLLPECTPLPLAARSGIAFMPHVTSHAVGAWRRVCELAGIDFLDPHAPSEETVQKIRRSRLVLADAMHAAVVADALRVPWIPLSLSPQTNTFKWLDWTLSVGCAYEPQSLTSSTRLEAFRSRTLSLYGERHSVSSYRASDALEHFARTVRRKSSRYWPTLRNRTEQLTYRLPRKLLRVVPEGSARLLRAADQLRRIAMQGAYLSEERIFNSKLEQLAALVPSIR